VAAGLDPYTIDRHVSFGVPPQRLDVLDMAHDVDVLEKRLDAPGDESRGIWTFELDLTDELGRILLGADTAGVRAGPRRPRRR
jgi:hypothetical protein